MQICEKKGAFAPALPGSNADLSKNCKKPEVHTLPFNKKVFLPSTETFLTFPQFQY